MISRTERQTYFFNFNYYSNKYKILLIYVHTKIMSLEQQCAHATHFTLFFNENLKVLINYRDGK